jgi:undecaprenyl diphosphate synthase
MGLFMDALKREVVKLHQNNIKLVMIGDRSHFDTALVAQIAESEQLTEKNTGLVLTIAANYGGRWDILQAANKMQSVLPQLTGNYREEHLTPYLSMSYAPEPDLFIRTGGEKRISNFFIMAACVYRIVFHRYVVA